MPFSRPSLTTLISQAAADIASAIRGADALLRFSNLNIVAKVLAGLAHLHYGYQDYIAKQAVPFTATDEFLEGWGALKNVIKKPATVANGQMTITGCVPNVEVAGEIPVVRGDGVNYIVSVGGVVDMGGNLVLGIQSVDPGANGNCDVGVVMTLGVAIGGIQSSGAVTTACTGGADVETNDQYRTRVLAAYQNAPQGGSVGDYINWALSVPGVTRAWCAPNGSGSGTVVVYFMEDSAEAAHDGFPQGTNGVATNETRATPAIGDQLVVANAIFILQPVTALVFACAPTPYPVDFQIAGLAGASDALKASIAAELADLFFRKGSPGGVYFADGTVGGVVDLSDAESAIAAIAGTSGFVINVPAGNITAPAGALPVLGNVTYV